jgi:hypothetical protein
MAVRFTDLEFMQLWFAHDRDRMPYPLRQRHLPVEDFAEHRRIVAAAVESGRGEMTPAGVEAFEVLARPEVRIEMRGFVVGPEQSDLRVLAGVRGDKGVLAVQQPDPQTGRAGDVDVALYALDDLASAIVHLLPAAEEGALDDIRFRREEIGADEEDLPYFVSLGQAAPLSMQQRLDRMFQRPRRDWGELAFHRGGAIDNYGRDTGIGFFWIHFPDGRYFVTNDEHIQARPFGDAMFAHTIDSFRRRTLGG